MVATYGRWRSAVLSKPRNNIYVDFDTRGDGQADLYAWGYYANGRLREKLMRYTQDSSVLVRRIRVIRPQEGRWSGRAIGFVVPRRSLRVQEGYLRWFASSSFRSQRYCRNVCWDYAPNRGMKGHAF